jgi:hypothetical protein
MEYNDDAPLFSSDAIIMIVVFIICVDCAKVPEYRCENCDKVYKQESRYKAHIVGCIDINTVEGIRGGGGSGGGGVGMDILPPSAADFSELLRQNREMMEMMRKQQDTIQLLVAQLVPQPKMNIE